MRIARAMLFVGAMLIVPTLAFGQVQLTELMPNPEGSDSDREWIEAVNTGSTLTVTTGRSGWRLFDGYNHLLKGESFTWQASEVVLFVQDAAKFRAEHSGVSARLIESSFSLKNSGETVRLVGEQGAALTEATYGEGEEGHSFIYSNGSWVRGQKGVAPGTYPDPSTGSGQAPSIGSGQAQAVQSVSSPVAPTQSSGAASISPLSPPAPPKPLVAATPAVGVPVVAPTPAPPPEQVPSFLISEFLPNTEGRDDDEFIELTNTNNNEAKLDDVVVQVGEKKLKLKGVASGRFLVLLKKDYHFSIRNKGETITLFWKDRPIHKISYSGAAPAGRSFARISDKWVWTKPTPGSENILVEGDSEMKGSSKNKGDTEASLQPLPLTAEARNQSSGNRVNQVKASALPLIAGFASALIVALAAVVFLK